MSSANYRERLRERQGPATLNATFRPAVNRPRRDPVELLDMIPAPPEGDPTPNEDELPPPPPAPPGLLSRFDADPPPPAPTPPLSPIAEMQQREDQRFIDTVNALGAAAGVQSPAEQPTGSSAAADEDNEPVEDGTEPLPEGSDSLGKSE